ncbi:MAG: carbon-nitrogen hydrolase family protein [Thermoplasmata archaeon]
MVQKRHRLGDKEYNLDIIEDVVNKSDSDLIIFPEMFLTGYTLRDDYWYEAEEIPGTSSKKISELARSNDCTIICGMPEKTVPGKGRVHNSALTATPDGELHVYRKTHLVNMGPFQDKRYFEAGNALDIIKTPQCNIGVLICYDIFFPELTKTYALKGADILVCISASPSATRKFFETVIPARAVETTSFMFYSNLIGREDQMVFWGGDTAVSPTGKLLAKGPLYEEAVIDVDIDLYDLVKARRGRPALDDTRKDVLMEQMLSCDREENQNSE